MALKNKIPILIDISPEKNKFVLALLQGTNVIGFFTTAVLAIKYIKKATPKENHIYILSDSQLRRILQAEKEVSINTQIGSPYLIKKVVVYRASRRTQTRDST